MRDELTTLLWCALAMSSLAAPDPAAPAPDPRECQVRGGLAHVLPKLEGGKPVRIAYLGGSITEANGWRPLSLRWLRDQYPGSAIEEINGAISGTGSDFGACRLQREVLQRHPDLLFVEFAVNDTGRPEETIMRAMEGIVRQSWRSDPAIDLCFVYTLSQTHLETVKAGQLPPSVSAMERVAERYQIPSIQLGLEVARLEREGRLIFKGTLPKTEAEKAALGDRIVFSGDGIHPYSETGHMLYLQALQRSFPRLKVAASEAARDLSTPPLDPANWEDGGMIPFETVTHQGAWQKLDPSGLVAKQTAKASAACFVTETPGDSISFPFHGRGFGIYSIKGPDAGQMAVRVDDQPPLMATLFDGFSTENRYRIKPWFYPKELANGMHQVTISLCAEPPDKAGILARSNVKMSDPKQFEALRLYVSQILLLGRAGE